MSSGYKPDHWDAVRTGEHEEEDQEPVDQHGNPLSGDRIINCPFPECGCDGSRLCMAENGPSRAACWVNIERGSKL